jgi:CHAD domain-containing protein
MESRLKRKRTMHRVVLTAICERLSKRRAALLRRAVIEAGQHDMFDICARLEKILGKTDSMTGAARHPAPYNRSPYASLKQPWRDFENQLAKSLRGAAPATLHKVRIKAKRLRYLLELIRDLGDRSADAPLFWLRRLQQCLGDWHDLEVQEKILLKMSSRRSFPNGPANRDIIATMISKMRGVKAGLAKRYLSMVYKSAERERLRRWITSHLVS